MAELSSFYFGGGIVALLLIGNLSKVKRFHAALLTFDKVYIEMARNDPLHQTPHRQSTQISLIRCFHLRGATEFFR